MHFRVVVKNLHALMQAGDSLTYVTEYYQQEAASQVA